MDDNKKRNLEEGGNNEDELKRKRIKLRCREADIKVIVGGEKQDTTTEKKVFWHYSQILASHSHFVDALLLAPLAAASTKKDDDDINDDDLSNNIKEISFPDISPHQWERMIFFVTNLVAIRDMTVNDAMELVVLYDKYDFHTGLKLCDKVLSSIFYKDQHEFKSHMMNNLELLDRCVHLVVLSHEKNLKQTLANGMEWLHGMFDWRYPTEYMILTVDHIRQLVPVIAWYKDDKGHHFVQTAILSRLSDESIDILNPMFPAYFVSQIQLIVARKATSRLVNQIQITGCARVAGVYDMEDCNDDDIGGTCIYYKESDDDNNQHEIYLKRNKIGDWIIETIDETLLFICNGSRCEALPPRTGWKRIDDADTEYQRLLPAFAYFSDITGNRREIDENKHVF